MSEQCTGLSLNVSLYQSLVAQSKITALIAKTTDVFDLLVRLRHFIILTSMHNQNETHKGLTMRNRTIFRVGKDVLVMCEQK